ncbi:MAG TPA: helical backbone metal receptor [Chitinophagaceae bacterium]|jgi:ABC-type Fe3+-hydroxamate transport system substrate-binding protein|nr:helical backbone metal receptor [Chitinophagaceae bacterium]
MPVFEDQTGRKVLFNKSPDRIISVVPSQTELLCDLGLNDEVIGITKFCVHPETWFKNKTKVGGTKRLNMEKILHLQPDLVIANKEENIKEQIEELEKYIPVWISDVKDLEDVKYMICEIGKLVGKEENALDIVSRIQKNFSQLKIRGPKRKSCYVIWQNPYMTVGGDTFINAMMEIAGFENLFKEQKRYPEITVKELKAQNPELILLSSEPFPFKQKHVDELQLQFPSTKIILVDGEMFSWYGSRLLNAPEYFFQLNKQCFNE